MIRKTTYWSVILIAGLGVLGWLARPFLSNTLPYQIKRRLPHEFLAVIQTPLPTALPAPDNAAPAPIRITLPPLPTALPTRFPPTPAHQQPPTATSTVIPAPAAALITGMTNEPQKFNNCGPTNLNIVLNFYGHTSNQLDIAASLKPNPDDRNISPAELVNYVNGQTTLRANAYSGGNLALLKRLIAAGFPVIIEEGLFHNEQEGWMGHYLTVYGYDDAVQEFTSMDTLLGPWDGGGRSDSYQTIADYWGHFNYTFVLVYQAKQETAVSALLTPISTDPLAMWQHATQIAQTTIDTQPDNAFAWFNLGTSLTHLGQLTEQPDYYHHAAAAFDQARTIGLPWRMLWYQFELYEAYLHDGRYQDIMILTDATRAVEESFLYKGYALHATGDETGAKAAYERALQLHPGYPPAQQALEQETEN